MRRSLCWAMVAAFLAAPVHGQSWEPEGGAFVLKRQNEYIRFDRGNWTAGMENGPSVRWYMFLWHDQWVHEALPGGKVDSGPKLEGDGSIAMSGTFSAHDNSPALRYAYRITPAKNGVRVRCELEKTGPLKLTSGVWLHVSTDAEHRKGDEQVWLSPTWHGPLGSPCWGTADKLLIELLAGQSVAFTPSGFCEAGQDSYSRGMNYRLNLVADDFEPGKTVTAEYTVAFADMPREFPGDVAPMRQPLRIGRVAPSAERVPRYERLELAVELGATYDNPYDPDQVALEAVFTAPSGKQLAVPGFFMVRHRREVADGAEVMIPEDNGSWRVRFTPVEVGAYSWLVRLRDRSGETAGGEGRFEATASDRPGFVRTSRADPHYLAFDDGRGFFAIGHNLPIYHTSGQLGDQAMRKMAAAGENYNRWWMSSSGFGIEWMPRLGWYRQDAAARIDLVLDVARELDMVYMMCMDTHQDFREQGWEANPFNAKNGGPCRTPGEWFTDSTAREFYKKRLRYTVARWGYSPNVLCWEFGNEFEGWADSPDSLKLPWHREMSDALRALDPFGHLITTSFWSHTGPEEFWQLPNIDIVQTHCYTNDDGNVAEPVRRYCLHQWERFPKPHIFGEFGIRSHSSTADKDPKGWGLHNALWAGLFSFSAGGPMPWWHENYIDPLDLYFHFTAIRNFTRDLPLGTARWEPLATGQPEFVDTNRKPETRDAVILPLSRWGKPEQNEFEVERDGSIAGDGAPQQLLHGEGHRDLKNPPTFAVDYPERGRFVVRVHKVSASGLLGIWIDDQQAIEKPLPCGEGLGKESVFRPQWNLWETTYDEDLAVDVPAGKHHIRVENLGRDWVEVAKYTLTGCKVLDKPNVLVCGMKTEGLAMLWIQNRESCWFNHAAGKVAAVPAMRVTVESMADGAYQAEWWDTWEGKIARRETLRAASGKLILDVPELATDVAVTLRPAKQ